ncbi:MAG: hypothetical protein MRZ79_03150 [Bacteroidia bacterium]|nr:hypothetical protein [Bacteroidia bacterium]
MSPWVYIMYIGNIIVAGWISISSLFFPKTAQMTVFEGNFAYSESIRLVGALWGAIFLISCLGMIFPEKMRFIFLFQLIYKSSWLLFAALPALLNKQAFPRAMAMFFIVWVILLPLVIPWTNLFSN